MHDPETTALFRRLIQQEIACAEALCRVLSDEQTALAASDPNALEQITAAKRELLGEMEQRVATHEGFLSARRLPAGKQGTELFVAGLPHQAPERGLWQRLRELAGQCRAQNEVNGSLLCLSRVRTQRVLELLHGPREGLRTYGRSGVTRSGSESQLIGRG